MANLSITTECNRQCRYCFARAALADQVRNTQHMPLETFQRAVDFLERSGIDEVRILGGEPTLHPDFTVLVRYVLERNLRLLVFSNGLMPETALRCLEATPVERAMILVNVMRNSPDPDGRDISILHESTPLTPVFQRLGKHILLGVNIDTSRFQWEFLLELIATYHLIPAIRLGLAHPCVPATNHYLHPHQYAAVGRRISVLADRANAAGVRLEFDCGFVPCMFPTGARERFGNALDDVGRRCNPILDILPDGQVIACYPLARLQREPLPGEHDASWLRAQFEKKLKSFGIPGIFRECSVCVLRANGACLGGCLAAAMQRFRHADFTFTLPSNRIQPSRLESKPDLHQKNTLLASPAVKAQWSVPYIDQPLSFWEQLVDDYATDLYAIYFPLPGGIIGSGRPPQPMEHVETFLRHAPVQRSVLINPIILPLPVEELAPQIIEALRRLAGENRIVGATISNLQLAARIREALPDLPLTASTLMDIAQPQQVIMLQGIFDALVPASRIVRDLPALKRLRAAFPGRIRLIVNEACLPACPFRTQHFYEMGNPLKHPHSLCDDVLQAFPWMRLTGAWVLPQHVHLYDGIYDELKLAGRVTLRDPEKYRQVLDAYIHRTPFFPNAIGGGPASVLEPIEISEEFFTQTLYCNHHCQQCSICRDYYQTMKGSYHEATIPS
jgi:hypothetical protein